MVGANFNFCSESDFCSRILLRKSFRAGYNLLCVSYQFDPPVLVIGHLFRVRTFWKSF